MAVAEVGVAGVATTTEEDTVEAAITEVDTVAGVTITMEEDMVEGAITEVDTVEADTMEVDMVAGDAD